jgi:RNA polymerase sigma-70 factor (ECF subfamily)
VREARPRFKVAQARGLEIAAAFFTASREGDMASLQTLLATDIVVHADGGGKRPAAAAPIAGIDQVLGLHAALARVLKEQGVSQLLRYGLINGLPGFVTREADGLLQTTALQIESERITAVLIVRNPDKLGRLERAMGG